VATLSENNGYMSGSLFPASLLLILADTVESPIVWNDDWPFFSYPLPQGEPFFRYYCYIEAALRACGTSSFSVPFPFFSLRCFARQPLETFFFGLHGIFGHCKPAFRVFAFNLVQFLHTPAIGSRHPRACCLCTSAFLGLLDNLPSPSEVELNWMHVFPH